MGSVSMWDVQKVKPYHLRCAVDRGVQEADKRL